MSLLEINDLKFKYTDEELFNSINFRLFQNDHIGLVGSNGAGKSTLMSLIVKNLKPDSGKIEWQPKLKIGYLDQHLKVEKHVTIHEYLYKVFDELFDKEKEMEDWYQKLTQALESEYEKILNRAYCIQKYLEENNFYQIKSIIGNVINGLGLTAFGKDTLLKNLSGGQRSKVFLAKLLLEEPDVLLMDEPTNFLDVNHIEWLTKYLSSFKGAFIVISHDKVFLNNICNVICALENRNLIRYKGNYDDYIKNSEIRNEQYQKNYESQQAFIKKTVDFIDKNITRSTTSKRAQSRQKMLNKLEVLEKPIKSKNLKFSFPFSKELGQEVLKVTNLQVGYSKPVLPTLNFLLKKNQKIAISGHNGVGKSTLLKTLMHIIPNLSGDFKFIDTANINYFAQETLYSKDENPINYIRNDYPLKTDEEIRRSLSFFGIHAKLILKKMNELSGGEQTKVRLCKMIMKKSNILILDEPTNHLDVTIKSALYNAIKEFPGCVILVSHEKEFYESFIDYEIKL